MGIRGIAKDYPAAVTVAAAAGVAIHWALYSRVHLLPDIAGAMADFADAWQIYIGFAAVVAISAGFAGVVVVFALSASSPRFRRLRHRSGKRLQASYLSTLLVSLVAAFGATVSSVLAASGMGRTAWWLFEFLMVVSFLSALRLAWLMHVLIQRVAEDDEEATAAAEAEEVAGVSLAQVVPHQRAPHTG